VADLQFSVEKARFFSKNCDQYCVFSRAKG